MRNDVCWKVQDERSQTGTAWMLVTSRTARQMGQEPAAVYYPPTARPYYQYRLTRRPKKARVLAL